MPDLVTALVILLVILLIFIIASLPLYLAVKFLGGKTSLLKAVAVNIVTGIIVSLVHIFFETYGSIIAFLIAVILYRELFRLKWWKAFIVWLVELAFVILLVSLAFLLAALLGISIITII